MKNKTIKIKVTKKDNPNSKTNPGTVKAIAIEETVIKPHSLLLRPVASIDEVVEAWESYQDLKHRLLNEKDYQQINGENYIKKSGWRKIQTAFGISDELIAEKRKDYGKYFVYEVTVKVSANSGRFAFGVGSCSSKERNFAHEEHDIRAIAHTRSKNRAISDLVGGGEVSAEEVTVDKSDEKKEQEDPSVEDLPYTELMTDKQKNLLTNLIYQKSAEPEDREKMLSSIESMSKRDASEIIGKLLNNEIPFPLLAM
jgi:hypothetical protein